MGGNKITGLANPTVESDGATKAYVDANVSGANVLSSSRVATTVSLIATYADVDGSSNAVGDTLTATSNGALIIDDITLNISDRVLVKNQASLPTNGVYIVTATGDGSNPFILTRSTDFDEVSEVLRNSSVFISEGTINEGVTWIKVTANATSVGSTGSDISFSQFSGSSTVTAGDGLAKDGNILSVNVGSGLEITSDIIQINAPISTTLGGTGVTSFTTAERLVATNSSNNGLETTTINATDVTLIDATQTLTNKTLNSATNTIRATSLATTSNPVVISGASAPSAGQALVATSALLAEWQDILAQANLRTLYIGNHFTEYTPYFNTIGAAITYINSLAGTTGTSTAPPSATAPINILVEPGTYIENTPLVIPSYVSISSPIQAQCYITPSDPNTPAVIDMSVNSYMSDVTIRGASGINSVGVRSNQVLPTVCRNVSVENCYIGFQCIGNGTFSSALMVIDGCYVITRPGDTVHTGYLVQDGGYMSGFISRASGIVGTTITYGYYVTGNNAYLNASISTLTNCQYGFYIDNGTAGNTAIATIKNALIINYTAVGVTVGNHSTVNLNGSEFTTLFPSTKSVILSASTSSLSGIGNQYAADTTDINNDAIYNTMHLSPVGGENAIQITSEVSIGTRSRPVEVAIGEGDSSTLKMVVLTTPDGTTFTDVTSIAANLAANTFPIFESTAIGEMLYIGHQDSTFPGIKINITTAIAPLQTSNQLLYEYWNGVQWVELYIMSTYSSAPYTHTCQFPFNHAVSKQIRFRNVTDWANSLTVNALTNHYWMRIRVASTLTTIPVLQSIKLHTNRCEINEDGFIEYYGNARPIMECWIPWVRQDGNNNTDQDIYLDSQLFIDGNYNEFSGAADNIVGTIFKMPNNLDTSVPSKIVLIWSAAATGDVTWNIIIGKSSAADLVSTTNGITAASTAYKKTITQTVNVTNINQLIETDFQLDTRFYIPSRQSGHPDHLWISLQRLGADANSGSAYVIGAYFRYTIWNNGNNLALSIL